MVTPPKSNKTVPLPYTSLTRSEGPFVLIPLNKGFYGCPPGSPSSEHRPGVEEGSE